MLLGVRATACWVGMTPRAGFGAWTHSCWTPEPESVVCLNPCSGDRSGVCRHHGREKRGALRSTTGVPETTSPREFAAEMPDPQVPRRKEGVATRLVLTGGKTG